jgi:flagellar biosynthesis protein FliQ
MAAILANPLYLHVGGISLILGIIISILAAKKSPQEQSTEILWQQF